MNGRAGLLLGILCSLAGSLIAAAAWFAVANDATDSLACMAWGVGAFAGLGMIVGYGTPDRRAGFYAAVIAAFGIAAAKIALYERSNSDARVPRNVQEIAVAISLAVQALEGQNIIDPDLRNKAWDAAFQQAKREAESMTSGELVTHYDKARRTIDFGEPATFAERFVDFAAKAFSFADLFFVLPALYIAYRIGAHGARGTAFERSADDSAKWTRHGT
jgi:hypothetical protein